MCFSQCDAELNIVPPEVRIEVAKEWDISLPSYLWQVHMSDWEAQVNKT